MAKTLDFLAPTVDTFLNQWVWHLAHHWAWTFVGWVEFAKIILRHVGVGF